MRCEMVRSVALQRCGGKQIRGLRRKKYKYRLYKKKSLNADKRNV